MRSTPDAGDLTYLNNRYHDPTLGTFISVDPLVQTTGEPYIYASGNPTTLSDPSGLCPMDSAAAAACAAAMYYGYKAQTAVYMSMSSVLPQEDAWEAWGIWSQADYCSQCEGFDIQAGSGNACLGMSGCAAAAQYLLDATDGVVQSASDEQFADAKWLAANYCNFNECGAGNALAYENQANFGAAAANVLLFGGGVVDDVARAATRAPLGERLFTNRWVGVESRLFGHSYPRGGVPGVLNRPGSVLKVGWTSSGQFGGGMHLRVGLGRSGINPNQALKHIDLAFSHVPNAAANPIVAGIRASRGFS